MFWQKTIGIASLMHLFEFLQESADLRANPRQLIGDMLQSLHLPIFDLRHDACATAAGDGVLDLIHALDPPGATFPPRLALVLLHESTSRAPVSGHC